MYFERRAHISAAFATERESSLKEINTVERCNRASLSFMLIHLENIPGRKPNNIHSTHSRWVFLKFESGCKWGSGYSRISHNHKVKSGHWRAEWHFNEPIQARLCPIINPRGTIKSIDERLAPPQLLCRNADVSPKKKRVWRRMFMKSWPKDKYSFETASLWVQLECIKKCKVRHESATACFSF